MWIFSGKCYSQARLNGKTAVITGCNTGIGKCVAEDFVRRGARVIMACRDTDKAELAAEDIRNNTKDVVDAGELVVRKLDLSSLASVRQFAQQTLETEDHINLLINNAGVMACPRAVTEDGIEMQFGVNHIGHFLLTCKLLPRILRSTPARIVNVSSLAHIGGTINFDDLNSEKSYSPTWAYAQSKLANILFTKELAKRLQGRGVNVYSLHPGVVATDLGRHFDNSYFPGLSWMFKNVCRLFIKSAEQGAQTTINCAVNEKLDNESGFYYSDCKKTMPTAKARDGETAFRLWEASEKIVGLDMDPFTAPDHARTSK